VAEALQAAGFCISHMTVARLLKQAGYSLKGNRKRLVPSSPQRDTQFRYLSWVRECFERAGHPVISVDTKKKELIGNFKNAGQGWCQEPEAVNIHDFLKDARGRAVPYGVYDPRHNQGYVVVGNSRETAELAVDAIVQWWENPQRPAFPDERRLLILCDGGGGNGYRSRLWKVCLQNRLADALQLEVVVCHYPTGASKWNPIEHRLFSAISLNWAGQPLRTFQTLLEYIRHTTNATGLRVQATLMDKVYPTGIHVPDRVMKTLNLEHSLICPQWNYNIKPRYSLVAAS
jgi:hypothetical protein